jgi:hypothetical protein
MVGVAEERDDLSFLEFLADQAPTASSRIRMAA